MFTKLEKFSSRRALASRLGTTGLLLLLVGCSGSSGHEESIAQVSEARRAGQRARHGAPASDGVDGRNVRGSQAGR
jgi:hypothetical protein